MYSRGEAMSAAAPVLIACVALAYAASAAAAQPAGTYEGTVAGRAVVVEFHPPTAVEPRSHGHYFYRSQAKPIALVPTQPGTWIECPFFSDTSITPCAAPTGHWTIAADGDVVRGTWRRSADAAAASPIDLKLLPAGVWQSRLELDEQRLVKAHARRHGVTWRAVRVDEEHSTIQLTRGPNPTAMRRINRQLGVGDQGSVEKDEQGRPYGLYAERLSVVFANARWLVVKHDTATMGAASYGGTGYRTFDLGTGHEVDWRKVFRFAPRDATLDLSRTDVIDALALSTLSGNPDSHWCAEDILRILHCSKTHCENLDGRLPSQDGWVGLNSVFPTRDGLAVSYDFTAHAMQGCNGTFVVVPWSRVRGAMQVQLQLP
jgi:hypothetical protein